MKIVTAVMDGIEPVVAAVECTLTPGFAGVKLIGNAAEVVRDGKERARATLENLGIHLPPQTLILNISPADVRKEGSQLDLPLAVAMALVVGVGSVSVEVSKFLFAGELSLHGDVKPIRGIVSYALAAIGSGLEGIVVSRGNRRELETLLRLGGDRQRPLRIVGVSHFSEVLSWLKDPEAPHGTGPLSEAAPPLRPHSAPNFDDMTLSSNLREVAIAAAVGMHSLLLRGVPGCGKSMFAERLPSILPPMDPRRHLECLRIHSAAAPRISPELLEGRPPFRAPHHQASANALLGSQETPGEMALAHGGILFLDELTEFRRDLLESLREPLETGEVRVSRVKRKVAWHARIMLVAACNNCPCGYFGSKVKVCRCDATRLLPYWAKLSGPLLQRIDIHFNVPEKLGGSGSLLAEMRQPAQQAQTELMRKIVSQARDFAMARSDRLRVSVNSLLRGEQLIEASGLTVDKLSGLVDSVLPPGVSQRSVVRCIRVARSLADMELRETIAETHLKKAYAWSPCPAAEERGEGAYQKSS